MMCFQAAYNYLDMLGEQPSHRSGRQRPHAAPGAARRARPGRGVARRLLRPLSPARGRRLSARTRSTVAARRWRSCLRMRLVAPAALGAAERIVEFQSCNTGERQGDLAALERWARAATPAGSDLRWWEVAAAGGSSLCVYALIALAAEPRLDARAVAAVSGGLLSLDRRAALPARQPRGRDRGSRDRAAQPDRRLCLAAGSHRAHAPAG